MRIENEYNFVKRILQNHGQVQIRAIKLSISILIKQASNSLGLPKSYAPVHVINSFASQT